MGTDRVAELAEFLCATKFADLPEEVVKHAKRVVLDFVGVAVAGAAEPEPSALLKVVAAGAVGGRSTVLAAPSFPKRDATTAAFINGTAAAFLEYDEGHRYYTTHGGIHTVPAALAVSEEWHSSGQDFLRAVVLGYEVSARLGGATHLRPAHHPHGSWPTVGAAVAVAMAAGRRPGEVREIISLAANLIVATSWRSSLEGATVRNAYVGHSNLVGIMANQLVGAGFTGTRDAVGETLGLFLGSEFSHDFLTQGLGRQFAITENYFKPYPCCQWTHSTVEAALSIKSRVPSLSRSKIRFVEIETFEGAATMTEREPVSSLGAKFSLPFCAAVALQTGRCDVDSFRPAGLSDPEVRGLAQLVTVRPNESYSRLYPERRASHVKVVTEDGTTYSEECLAARSHEHSADDAEVREKFLRTTRDLLSESGQVELVQRVFSLDSRPDMAGLLDGI